MTIYRHIIFLITIVALLAAFILFIPGCVGAPVIQIAYSQRETNNPNWRPPAAYTVQTSEGWDKETGCAIEIKHEKTGIVLRLVPAGEFDMGSNDNEKSTWGKEGPVHKVKISEPFYIGKYEVTQKEWKAVMENNPSGFKGDNLPVETVSWNDVQKFCWKADDGLRLPSEAEWEYACRAGTTTPFNTGKTITIDQANYAGHYPYGDTPKGVYRKKTTEVGSFAPNAWGLYDMHGNVQEWCQDVYHNSYEGADRPDDGRAWTTGGKQSHRVRRGGSWGCGAWNTRSTLRSGYRPGVTTVYLGFRVVVGAGAVR